jgi:hypothetical protein
MLTPLLLLAVLAIVASVRPMTDLVANDPRSFHGDPQEKIAFPMNANSQLFAGAALMVSSGYAANCTPTASGLFLGFAVEAKDNRTGSPYGGTANSTTIEASLRGIVVLKNQVKSSGNWAAADVGATFYALDGNVLTDSAGTNNIIIGKIVKISVLGGTTADVFVSYESSMLRSI